jgi:hypothetical protein
MGNGRLNVRIAGHCGSYAAAIGLIKDRSGCACGVTRAGFHTKYG